MAQRSAVEPSRAGSFTLTRLASSARTPCKSSFFAAATSVGSTPAALPTRAEIARLLARVVGRSQRNVRRVHIIRPTSLIGARTRTLSRLGRGRLIGRYYILLRNSRRQISGKAQRIQWL